MLIDIKEWMLANKLKLNDDKTEFLLFNPRSFDIETNSLIFGSETINLSPSAKLLEFILMINLLSTPLLAKLHWLTGNAVAQWLNH